MREIIQILQYYYTSGFMIAIISHWYPCASMADTGSIEDLIIIIIII